MEIPDGNCPFLQGKIPLDKSRLPELAPNPPLLWLLSQSTLQNSLSSTRSPFPHFFLFVHTWSNKWHPNARRAADTTNRWRERKGPDPSAEIWISSGMNRRHKSGLNTQQAPHASRSPGSWTPWETNPGLWHPGVCLFEDVHRRAADIYSAFGSAIPSLPRIDAAVGAVETVRQHQGMDAA